MAATARDLARRGLRRGVGTIVQSNSHIERSHDHSALFGQSNILSRPCSPGSTPTRLRSPKIRRKPHWRPGISSSGTPALHQRRERARTSPSQTRPFRGPRPGRPATARSTSAQVALIDLPSSAAPRRRAPLQGRLCGRSPASSERRRGASLLAVPAGAPVSVARPRPRPKGTTAPGKPAPCVSRASPDPGRRPSTRRTVRPRRGPGAGGTRRQPSPARPAVAGYGISPRSRCGLPEPRHCIGKRGRPVHNPEPDIAGFAPQRSGPPRPAPALGTGRFRCYTADRVDSFVGHVLISRGIPPPAGVSRSLPRGTGPRIDPAKAGSMSSNLSETSASRAASNWRRRYPHAFEETQKRSLRSFSLPEPSTFGSATAPGDESPMPRWMVNCLRRSRSRNLSRNTASSPSVVLM